MSLFHLPLSRFSLVHYLSSQYLLFLYFFLPLLLPPLHPFLFVSLCLLSFSKVFQMMVLRKVRAGWRRLWFLSSGYHSDGRGLWTRMSSLCADFQRYLYTERRERKKKKKSFSLVFLFSICRRKLSHFQPIRQGKPGPLSYSRKGKAKKKSFELFLPIKKSYVYFLK